MKGKGRISFGGNCIVFFCICSVSKCIYPMFLVKSFELVYHPIGHFAVYIHSALLPICQAVAFRSIHAETMLGKRSVVLVLPHPDPPSLARDVPFSRPQTTKLRRVKMVRRKASPTTSGRKSEPTAGLVGRCRGYIRADSRRHRHDRRESRSQIRLGSPRSRRHKTTGPIHNQNGTIVADDNARKTLCRHSGDSSHRTSDASGAGFRV